MKMDEQETSQPEGRGRVRRCSKFECEIYCDGQIPPFFLENSGRCRCEVPLPFPPLLTSRADHMFDKCFEPQKPLRGPQVYSHTHTHTQSNIMYPPSPAKK